MEHRAGAAQVFDSSITADTDVQHGVTLEPVRESEAQVLLLVSIYLYICVAVRLRPPDTHTRM